MIFDFAPRFFLRTPTRCVVMAAVLLWTGVRAETDPPPKGVYVGPWVISPLLGAGASVDTNPFYRSDTDPEAPTRKNERVLRFVPQLRAALPFRNSLLELRYEGTRTDYARTILPNKWSHLLGADLALLFSTMDRVTVSGERTSGVSEIRIFDGGETVFDGVPFTYLDYGVEAAREVEGERGYRVSVDHSELQYGQSQFSFFEFQGNELGLEVLEPSRSSMWLSASVTVRRFEHYLADRVSVTPYRSERSTAVWIGVENGARATLHLKAKAGWGNWRFPGGEGKDYRGLSWNIVATARPRASSLIDLNLERRVWPSFYGPNNYYLTTTATARVEQAVRPGLQLAATVSWGTSQYDVPFPEPTLRHDRTRGADVYATLEIARQFALVFGVSIARRTSNDPNVEYSRKALSVGTAWGWR